MYRARNILFFFFLAAILWSCSNEVKDIVNKDTNPEKVPTVISRNVSTLISDSGVTRYRITAKLWNIFQEAQSPYWNFPNGLKLEQLNPTTFAPEASVSCDSATFITDLQLWRLDRNVIVCNILKDTMWTQQLFWDQRRQEIRSDSFIHIRKQNRIIEGTGFNSNETFTNYEIRQVSGIFPMQPGMPGAPGQAPSKSPDTTSVSAKTVVNSISNTTASAKNNAQATQPTTNKSKPEVKVTNELRKLRDSHRKNKGKQ